MRGFLVGQAIWMVLGAGRSPCAAASPTLGRAGAGGLLVGLAVLGAVIGVRALQAWFTRYVVTDLRVLRVHGVLNRHAEFIPWGKVTDIARTETLFQWMARTATIRIESANERSGLRTIDDVDDPGYFYRVLVEMVDRKQGRIADVHAASRLSRPRADAVVELRVGATVASTRESTRPLGPELGARCRPRPRRRARCSSTREPLRGVGDDGHVAISARIDTFAADLAPRSSDSTCPAISSACGSAVGGERPQLVGVGPRGAVDRTLHPPRPHLFGGERAGTGRTGGAASTARRRARPVPTRSPPGRRCVVGPALDQLQVVVAEAPEEVLGALQRPGVVVAARRRRWRPSTSSASAGQHRPVERLGDRARRARSASAPPKRQRELGRVEQLDRQAAPDLHLLLVERGVRAGPARRRPVAHAVGAVLLEQVDRGDHVALRLGHLLAVGVEDPARQRDVGPRHGVELVVAAQHGGEQPGADDVVALWSQVHGEGQRRTARRPRPTGRRSAG